ncbi:hypothetical protein KCP71_09410 [Salmonella enterica subsp. enterica]|nr:hypothetical protein KCP71_09410 [Salmonella enterica subsp. enterica]
MPALFTRKERYVTAGRKAARQAIATQFYERTLLCPDKSAMLQQQPAPPRQTFCRSKPPRPGSFWNFLT